MAYFSSSSEAHRWQHDNCSRCVHEPDPDAGKNCPILMLHETYNYDQFPGNRIPVARADAIKRILEALIPMDGMRPGKCSMLVEKD